MMSSLKSPAVAVLLLTAFWAAPPRAEAAVDPFYELLFEDGQRAAARGDTVGAAKMLRLACFGMLQEPPALADCLTHLALAQADLEDQESFRETVGRLLQAERLFEAWTQADLSSEERRRLEERMAAWMPEGELDGVAGFSRAGAMQRSAAVRALPLEERRRALDRELALAPDSKIWRRMWAELELESGRPSDALRAAETVLRASPGDRGARCVRGRARASLGECDASAVDDLAACGVASADAVAERLGCLVELSDWSSASDLLDMLSASVLESPDVRELERVIRRGRRGENGNTSS